MIVICKAKLKICGLFYLFNMTVQMLQMNLSKYKKKTSRNIIFKSESTSYISRFIFGGGGVVVAISTYVMCPSNGKVGCKNAMGKLHTSCGS